MDIRVPVRLGNLIVVNFRQPVVGSHRAGIAQNQSPYRVSDCGILLNPPVLHLHIAVDNLFIIQDRRLHSPHLFSLLPVQDIGLGHISIPALAQHIFHRILNFLHLDPATLDFPLKICRHPQCQHLQHILAVIFFCGLKCLSNGIRYFRQLKIHHCPVSFFYLKHILSPL